jgi:hypothetical protein
MAKTSEQRQDRTRDTIDLNKNSNHAISSLWLIHTGPSEKELREITLHSPSSGPGRKKFQTTASVGGSVVLISSATETICLRCVLPAYAAADAAAGRQSSFDCYELEIPQECVTHLHLTDTLPDAVKDAGITIPATTEPVNASLTFLTIGFDKFALNKRAQPTKKFESHHRQALEAEGAFRSVGQAHHPPAIHCLPGTVPACDYTTGSLVVALLGKRIHTATFFHDFRDRAVSVSKSVLDSLAESASRILPK